jgi:ABC-2 type transport system ATP-binding protein
VLDRLDQAAIEVDGLTVHTPDLDDVFLALTGQPEVRPEPRPHAQEAIAR